MKFFNTNLNQDNRNNIAIKENGCGVTPRLAMMDRRLSIEAKAIYSYLCTCAGSSEDICHPNVRKMIIQLNITKTRYYSHFSQLVKFGYVKVEKSGNKNIFILCNSIPLLEEEFQLAFPEEEMSNMEIITKENSKNIPDDGKNNSPKNKDIECPNSEDKDLECPSINDSKTSIYKGSVTRSFKSFVKRSVKRSVKTTTKESVVDSSKPTTQKLPTTKKSIDSGLYQKIKEKLKTAISKPMLNKLLQSFGETKILEYLNNWNKFDHIQKTNPAGYFIWLIRTSFPIPQKTPQPSFNNSFMPFDNRTNYEERPCVEGEYDKYSFDVEKYMESKH